MISRTTDLVMPFAERLSYLDTIIRWVLYVYIAVLPFKALLVVERTGFLVLLGLLAVWCLLARKLFYVRTPVDLMLLTFVLWVGFTIPFSSFPEYSLKEYGKLLQWIILFYAVLYFLRDPSYRRLLLYVLGSAALIVAAHGVTQFNVSNPQAVVGVFSAEVWFTTFLVMIIPFGLAVALSEGPRTAKGVCATATILAVGGLLGTQSRAGLVAFMAGLLAVTSVVRSTFAKLVSGIVTICLVAAMLIALYIKTSSDPADGLQVQRSIPVKTGVASIVHRLDIWQFTLSEIAKHWLVGIGYGGQTYPLLYGQEDETVEPGHTSIKDTGTHNILLYLSLHVGLPGMVLFVWFYFSAIRATVREYRKAVDWLPRMVLAGTIGSMIGLFVRLQFDQMFVGSLALFFWVLLATAIIHYPSMKHVSEQGAST